MPAFFRRLARMALDWLYRRLRRELDEPKQQKATNEPPRPIDTPMSDADFDRL